MIHYADRVQETTVTTGTGTLTLAGPTTGNQSFVAGVGDGAACRFLTTDGVDWEIAEGTVTYTFGGSDTLSRTTIVASSNNGTVVSWAAGTKNVSLEIDAARMNVIDPDATPYEWHMSAQSGVTGDPVSQWDSADIAASAFTQGTAANQPDYQASVLNSLPGIYFDGSNDHLACSSNVVTGTEHTLTVVGKLGASAFAVDQVIISCSDTATADYYWELGIDSAGKFYVEAKNGGTVNRVTGNTVMSPSGSFVVTVASDGFDWTLIVNRTAQTLTLTSGANTGDMPSGISGIDNTVLGAKVSTTTAKYFQGWIVLITDIADWRGAAAINSIQSPLMKTYSIT